MQLLIGESANFPRFALPDQRGLVFARRLHVPIEAVIRKVDLATDEPLRPGMVPFEDLVPLLEPVQLFGNAAPKFFRMLDRLTVDAVVFFGALDVSLPAKIFRTLKLALLLQNGINAGAGNGDGCLICHSGLGFKCDRIAFYCDVRGLSARATSRNLCRSFESGSGHESYLPKKRYRFRATRL